MSPTFSTLLLDRRDNGILLVTLNRPEAANAMNTQMGLDLMTLFEGFSVDLEGLRAVVLTGQGKVFCAGGDLKQRNGMTDEPGRRSISCSSACCARSSPVRCR